MAAFHGKQGSGSFTSLTFEITGFTVDATADVAESGGMMWAPGGTLGLNPDGGSASTVHLVSQDLEGGAANTVYFPSQLIDGGNAS